MLKFQNNVENMGKKSKKKIKNMKFKKVSMIFFKNDKKKYNKKMKQKYKIISNNKKLHFPKLQSYGPTTYHIP